MEYVSGVAGGVAVVCVGHPFDTCKTRMQTAPDGFYKNTVDCVRKTYGQEGLRGFYAGVLSPLFGQMFFRAASFTTFRFVLSSSASEEQPSAGNHRGVDTDKKISQKHFKRILASISSFFSFLFEKVNL